MLGVVLRLGLARFLNQAMDLIDCYRWLELAPGADLAQIKAAYRRLARRYHPDVNPGNPTAQAQFVALHAAYRTLLQAGDRAPAPFAPPPPPNPLNAQLKRDSYRRLQHLLRQGRFARAIALVEGLALRLPEDAEVRQWQAIAYQGWARHLWAEGRHDKAQLYFHKALRTDPHNRALRREVSRDLERLAAEVCP